MNDSLDLTGVVARGATVEGTSTLDEEPLSERKTEVIASILRNRIGARIGRTLVVGCGSGLEAAVLGQALGTHVIGVDIESNFDADAARRVELRQADATQLSFADASFDLVYSYHALEHIPKYRQALREMHRVLRPQGHFCVGTPNRSRLVGYIGSKTATMRKKILWNLVDWKARLTGRFRNECGAHAGFTKEELSGALVEAFGNCEDITLDYYADLYRRRAGVIRNLDRSGLSRFFFPAVYFMGCRE